MSCIFGSTAQQEQLIAFASFNGPGGILEIFKLSFCLLDLLAWQVGPYAQSLLQTQASCLKVCLLLLFSWQFSCGPNHSLSRAHLCMLLACCRMRLNCTHTLQAAGLVSKRSEPISMCSHYRTERVQISEVCLTASAGCAQWCC